MADADLAALHRALAAIPRGPGKPYPRSLRERVARWARGRIAAGESVGAIAMALGVDYKTLRKWLAAGQPSAPAMLPKLVAVEVVEPARTALVAVVSPSGFRVEGLSLAAAAELLRAVG